MLIYDFKNNAGTSEFGTSWRGVSDRVMGGVSDAHLSFHARGGRPCMQLSGAVRLDYNGGFIQASLPLHVRGGEFDASGFSGLRLLACGNGEQYSVHLRTPDNLRPWQSYRAHFQVSPEWRDHHLPFAEFSPHRVLAPLDTKRLLRIGLVAIGRAFEADLCIAELAFYA